MASSNKTEDIICSLSDLKSSLTIRHSFAGEVLKGEDVVFHESDSNYELFALCDGHAGSKCASFVKSEFWKLLRPRLPVISKDASNDDTFAICTKIRRALLTSFTEVDAKWYEEQSLSGTTMTVALISGRILTVANVGDSDSYLHTGNAFFQLTKSHRVDFNTEEYNRLKAAWVKLAPLHRDLHGPAADSKSGLGPVRVWPGGLAISRSIGDADVSPHVICVPHIRQVLIPATGARLVLASDGVWDHLAFSKMKHTIKKKSLEKCSTALVKKALTVQGVQMKDDTTVYTVDMVPSPSQDFKDIIKSQQEPKKPLQRLKKQLPRSRNCIGQIPEKQGLDHGKFLADVDGLIMFKPDEIIRSVEPLNNVNEPHLTTDDFTVHGSQSARGNCLQSSK